MNLDLTASLRQHFGFTAFRPGQEATLTRILNRQDTLAILPTGAGKSLLYQLPAYHLTGTILVISPLIALMQDQADRIARQGDYRAVVLNSTVEMHDQAALLETLGDYRFIFTSPETLARGPVLGALRQLKIALLVVDEAHCISEWGPNFRPEYLTLKNARQALKPGVTLLLTATAPPQIAQDILTKMAMAPEQVATVRQSVNRANLFLAVHPVADPLAKQHYLQALLPRLGGPGVIYFSSRKQATAMANWLEQTTSLQVAAYHAGLEPVVRYRLQTQFMQNQVDVICATSAFGMGIDKNDIRYVIHYHMPAGLAAYTQEIGRAGRDGQPALTLLLYAPGDESLPELLTQTELPAPAVLEEVMAGRVAPTVLGPKADVINFYLHHGVTPQQLQQLMAQQSRLAQQRINEMLGYVMTTACRRQYLLHAFGEKPIEQALCCDCHQSNWQPQELGLGAVKTFATVERSYNWRQQLAHFFAC